MTDSMTSAIALSPFDWQEAEVGSLRPRSRFRFRLAEGERLRYEEMFTVISVFQNRFLKVHATKCGDNLTIKTAFKEFSLSPSDIVLVVPFHENTIANEANMTKLIVFDDSVLNLNQDPGALHRINMLRSKGWTIALVSNQGHCGESNAREDVQATADLFGIELAAFCPVKDGSEMTSLAKINGQWRDSRVTSIGFEALFGVLIPDINFWLPNPGMLLFSQERSNLEGGDRCLFVSGHLIDRVTTDSIGFEFISAHEWRS